MNFDELTPLGWVVLISVILIMSEIAAPTADVMAFFDQSTPPAGQSD